MFLLRVAEFMESRASEVECRWENMLKNLFVCTMLEKEIGTFGDGCMGCSFWRPPKCSHFVPAAEMSEQ